MYVRWLPCFTTTVQVGQASTGRPEMEVFRKLLKKEDGATAIEYGLIAVAAITAMSSLGTNLSATFTKVSDKMS